MLELKNDYVRIPFNGTLSYGGSQMWSESKVIRTCACGPVAALDTLLYLRGQQNAPFSAEEYNQELTRLCRFPFPLLYPVGINGVMLAAGMNALLLKYKLPYRAFWAFSGIRFWTRVEEMLSRDIPVIFSVGPNFPAVWKKNRLRFYRRRPDGSYVPVNSTRSHYVTATGMDEHWLRISSWGNEYYINRSEYDEYVKKHSASLVSNVLMLHRIG